MYKYEYEKVSTGIGGWGPITGHIFEKEEIQRVYTAGYMSLLFSFRREYGTWCEEDLAGVGRLDYPIITA